MAKVLVVYATAQGQTAKIAGHIQRLLQGRGHGVELFDTAHPRATLDLERFDAVVVGGPVHARGYPRSLRSFVREHRDFLLSVRAAFFSVGLAIASKTHDGRAQTLPLVENFVNVTGWRPARVELIAGALTYSKYNLLVRWVMRRIAKSEGGDTDTSRDYEYTDWEAVERFACEIVSNVEPSEPSSQARA